MPYSRKQRLILVVVAGIGVLLLFLSVMYEVHKFASKLAEVIGEALFLAVFVKVFLVYFYTDAPTKQMAFMSDSTHQETEERLRNIQREVHRLSGLLEGLSRQINHKRTG